jgi:hypothetical protein
MTDSVDSRIQRVSASIQDRLGESLTTDGKIDLQKLKENDAALHEVLHRFAESKTWRDDPRMAAVDVAKLLEAQSHSTPLGAALNQLKSALNE